MQARFILVGILVLLFWLAPSPNQSQATVSRVVSPKIVKPSSKTVSSADSRIVIIPYVQPQRQVAK